MFRSWIVTASDSGLRRRPPHALHGLATMYSASSIRTVSDSVSLQRRWMFATMPSHVAVGRVRGVGLTPAALAGRLAAGFPVDAVEEAVAHPLRQVVPRRIQIELELLGEPRQDDASQIPVGFSPRQDDALENRQARVAEDELFAHLVPRAEAAARGARAERRVEREVSRLELRHRDAARRAPVALREQRWRCLGTVVP